jgi:hypothetical protein
MRCRRSIELPKNIVTPLPRERFGHPPFAAIRLTSSRSTPAAGGRGRMNAGTHPDNRLLGL